MTAVMPMRPKRVFGPALFIAAVLVTASAWCGESFAADSAEPPAKGDRYQDLEGLIERELDRLRDHLEGALNDLPRYALPEMNEDGDIIIRRLPRRPEGWPHRREEPSDTLDL